MHACTLKLAIVFPIIQSHPCLGEGSVVYHVVLLGSVLLYAERGVRWRDRLPPYVTLLFLIKNPGLL